ncbi:MAG: hypothetical protein M3Q80_00170 [bacterium]|nr:hypothetical protein [bacterium]
MRHSFLPTIEQKKLKREYHIHLLVVMLFFLSAVGLIGSASLFPSYVQINIEAKEQQGAMNILKSDNDQSGIADLEKELGLHAIRMAALGDPKQLSVASVIESVVGIRGTVKIEAISIDQTFSTTSMIIKITGKAPTRDSLSGYKSRLEKMVAGTKVELPLSDFAKNKDIPFTMRVTQPR